MVSLNSDAISFIIHPRIIALLSNAARGSTECRRWEQSRVHKSKTSKRMLRHEDTIPTTPSSHGVGTLADLSAIFNPISTYICTPCVTEYSVLQ